MIVICTMSFCHRHAKTPHVEVPDLPKTPVQPAAPSRLSCAYIGDISNLVGSTWKRAHPSEYLIVGDLQK